MKLHGNAALSLNGRRRMVRLVSEQDRSITEAALAAGVSERTCSKWVGRYRREGDLGLLDRSSAPNTVHNRTDEQLVQLLASLRRLRRENGRVKQKRVLLKRAAAFFASRS